ncbi:MAG: hypothetical protein PVH54_02240 [Gammaproteobacteria bacterium]
MILMLRVVACREEAETHSKINYFVEGDAINPAQLAMAGVLPFTSLGKQQNRKQAISWMY